jgi:acyl-CoA thioesterase I
MNRTIMKTLLHAALGLASLCAGGLARAADPADWAQLGRYQAANLQAGQPQRGEARVVFLGDSITDFWAKGPADVFAVPGRLNRGISGQTTPQMLVRLRQDVIDLHPQTLVILAGTNDIAGNTGPASLAQIEGNLASMAELARVHGIRVVLCAVLPADHYEWAPEVRPAETIRALNRWIKGYARAHSLAFVDYHGALADEAGGLPKRYSEDGVHPNEAGYAVMGPLVERALGAMRRH